MTVSVNIKKIIALELNRRGYVLDDPLSGLPENVDVKVAYSIPEKNFIVTDELVHFLYPGCTIYKPDLELIKEKILESFCGLQREDQELFQKYWKERLSANEKV